MRVEARGGYVPARDRCAGQRRCSLQSSWSVLLCWCPASRLRVSRRMTPRRLACGSAGNSAARQRNAPPSPTGLIPEEQFPAEHQRAFGTDQILSARSESMGPWGKPRRPRSLSARPKAQGLFALECYTRDGNPRASQVGAVPRRAAFNASADVCAPLLTLVCGRDRVWKGALHMIVNRGVRLRIL